MSQSKQIAISDDEMTFARRVGAGMARADAYRVTFKESEHMDADECLEAANKLCRTKRVASALKGFKADNVGPWVADYGAEMAALDQIIIAAMLTEPVYSEGRRIPDSDHYTNLGAAVAAIDKKIKIKDKFCEPGKKLERVERVLKMREKGIISEEQLTELVRQVLS